MNKLALSSFALVFAAQLAGCGATTLAPAPTDAAADTVDGARPDAAEAADAMCGVLCASPPPGCHYEGPQTCSPPSCGTLVCPDAGPPVSCGGATSTFPSFARACRTADDCFVALHQIDCCGSRQALGLAVSQRAAFQAAETTCERMYPACECAARPTQVDDGASAPTEMSIVVACDAGRCATHIPRTPRQHRTSDTACATTPAPGMCSIPVGPPVICHADSDCTMGRNGRCVTPGGGPLTCQCTYDTCAHDSDCSMGGPCACHGGPYLGAFGNTCVPGNCRTDADCGAGGYCSPSRSTMGCGGLGGYDCHTPRDLCTDDEDCTSSSGPQGCAYIAARARWECSPLLLCP